MEGNNWYNRTGYTDYRNHAQGDERPLDQDVFRGSYRLDNDSDHHNRTTYYDNGGHDRGRRHGNFQEYGNRRTEQPGHNRDYERDWSDVYHNSRGAFDREDYGQEYGRSDRHQNQNQNQSRQYSSGLRDFRESGNLNTNPEYGPDHYGYGQGENYGNMAGTLSYGYDGLNNYNPDWNTHYDPLTGNLRSSHGNYPTRRPNYYDERDRQRNPDDFRPLDR